MRVYDGKVRVYVCVKKYVGASSMQRVNSVCFFHFRVTFLMTEIWLEGSVHRDHNQPDITAQLVNSANHVH